MFNWICPECGRDVSPSATECPYCAERKKAAGTAVPVADPTPGYGAPPPPATLPPPQAPQYKPEPPAYAPAPPQPPLPQAPPPQPPPPQPQYAAPPQYAAAPPQYPAQAPPPPQPYYSYPPPQKAGPPAWLMAIVSALAFLGLIAGVYWGYQYFGKGPRAERAGVTEPAATARNKPSNPLQKYIEVVGIRLVSDARKRPEARFVVVNHSNTEFSDISANVTIWASTSRSEEDSVGTFTFKLDSIGANESKEMTAPLTTKLKAYELPDWQNITADVQITAP
jgi:hypothetical protein